MQGKELFTLLDLCMSSWRRGHANLLSPKRLSFKVLIIVYSYIRAPWTVGAGVFSEEALMILSFTGLYFFKLARSYHESRLADNSSLGRVLGMPNESQGKQSSLMNSPERYISQLL